MGIRVIVVDDSAFARKVMRESLEVDRDFDVVAIARDGLDALEKITLAKPDVVTLDLTMPNLDGIGLLEALRELSTPPRVVVVSISGEDSELGVSALRAGAFDVIAKPTALASAHLYDLGQSLRDAVRAAASAKPTDRRAELTKLVTPAKSARELLVIGASTGGPQAIAKLVRATPADFSVPVAIVLHMPFGYTAAYTARLDGESAVEVVESYDGIALTAGRVVVARAGRNFAVQRSGGSLVGVTVASDVSQQHRPSVDALFESVASAGINAVAIVLTGMGADGTAGAGALAKRGLPVLTESESSCIVYGMPRSVVEAGFSTASASLDQMPQLLRTYL